MTKVPALLSTEPRLPVTPAYHDLVAGLVQILKAAKDTSLGSPQARLARIVTLAEASLLRAELSDVSGDNA